MKFDFLRKSYFFVEGDTLVLQNKLTMAGIKSIPAEIKTPYEAKGIAFIGRHMDKALAVLEVNKDEVHLIPTNDSKLTLLSKYGVIVESEDHLEELSWYYGVVLDFAKKHNLLVYLSNPHGEPSPINSKPNTLSIRFWSNPVQSKSRKITRVFGITLDDNQSDAVEADGINNLLIDPNTNIAVAGLIENTLYVFFDLPDGENTGVILSEILSRYDELRLTPEEKRQREENRRKALLNTFAADYIKACTDRYKGQAKGTDEALVKIAKEIDSLTSQLAKKISDQKMLFATKQAIDKLGGDYSVIFQTELKRLQESSKISKLLVEADALWVETVVLSTPEDENGRSWELGAYQIVVSFNNSMPKVSNLTRQVDGDSHPYDTGGGDLCYGNVTTSIAQYLASQEYSFVVDAVINFLEYSPLSYGDMRGWPEVQKEQINA